MNLLLLITFVSIMHFITDSWSMSQVHSNNTRAQKQESNG